ncbi:hypothetical protein KM043_003986 [Ampulex compressa]|nr:hypothetical protein KM043_003986 [Ampulex compressa]
MADAKSPRVRVVTATVPPFVMYNEKTDVFSGYCVDLFTELISTLGLNYTMRITDSNEYGDMERDGVWTGAVRELISDDADVSIGPIWVTRARESVVDFTIPIYEQTGIAIMMMKQERNASFFRFLQVLELKIWLAFAAAFFLTSLLLYIFERRSPFSYKNRPKKSEDESLERFSRLKECFWFAATSITPQGGGSIPQNLSGKVIVATWWLFGFVIVAAYTANLAAYETRIRLERHIESLEDLNRQYTVLFSTFLNSPTERHFRRQAEVEMQLYDIWMKISLNQSLSDWDRSKYALWEYPFGNKYVKILNSMEDCGFFVDTNAAIAQMRNESGKVMFKYAIITEVTRIRYVTMTHCDVRQVGKEFSKRPVAFMLRQGSPLRDKFNQALVELQIAGKFRELREKWWDNNPLNAHCPPEKDVNVGFGLELFTAVFLTTILGILLAVLIISVQYCWYSSPQERKRRLEHYFEKLRSLKGKVKDADRRAENKKTNGRKELRKSKRLP